MTDKALPTISANLARRHVIMGLSMIGVAGTAALRMPQTLAKPIATKKFDSMIPRSVGKWGVNTSSEFVLPPPDSMTERLYDNLLTRAYVAPEESPVLLLIAYNNSQDGVLQVHRPEVCYPVAGYRLTETRILDVPTNGDQTIRARSFTATAPTRTEHVLYWTRVGPHMPTSWAEQRMAVVKENLKKIEPDGLMFRLSIVSDDAQLALQTMKRFVLEFHASLTPPARALLFGNR
jgi:EpsI family protein